jgi:hypothetical protein
VGDLPDLRLLLQEASIMRAATAWGIFAVLVSVGWAIATVKGIFFGGDETDIYVWMVAWLVTQLGLHLS